eukprot:TRINITY_DN12322_c0_g2_i1.p1 TRINITY_DN12322_c0_g2~~TRINITY_DN12322_c0_g2_i1.p1  ORF type:complete len:944 (+),score=112.73 TRINITY_DN12322_c0_g2_i1:132-2963(+)
MACDEESGISLGNCETDVEDAMDDADEAIGERFTARGVRMLWEVVTGVYFFQSLVFVLQWPDIEDTWAMALSVASTALALSNSWAATMLVSGVNLPERRAACIRYHTLAVPYAIMLLSTLLIALRWNTWERHGGNVQIMIIMAVSCVTGIVQLMQVARVQYAWITAVSQDAAWTANAFCLACFLCIGTQVRHMVFGFSGYWQLCVVAEGLAWTVFLSIAMHASSTGWSEFTGFRRGQLRYPMVLSGCLAILCSLTTAKRICRSLHFYHGAIPDGMWYFLLACESCKMLSTYSAFRATLIAWQCPDTGDTTWKSDDSQQGPVSALQPRRTRPCELGLLLAEALCIVVYWSYRHHNKQDMSLNAAKPNPCEFCHRQDSLLLSSLIAKIALCSTKITSEVANVPSTILDGLSWMCCAFLLGFQPVDASLAILICTLTSYRIILMIPFARACVIASLCLVSFCVGIAMEVIESGPDRQMASVPERAHLLGPLCCSFIMSLGVKRFLEHQSRLWGEMVEECQQQGDDNGLSFGSSSSPAEAIPIFKPRGPASVRSLPTSLRSKISRQSDFTLKSAPAVLEGHCKQGAGLLPLSQGCMDGDCLPEGSLVWVEGHALPRRVETVSSGERVLCFDRLSGSVKHASVLAVEEQASGQALWCKISLSDGTSVEVTSDHPLHPVKPCQEQRAQGWGPWGGGRPGFATPASNLKAGEDHLLVLKVEPVSVESLTSHWSSKPRISLTVQQSERHTIFVAAQSKDGALNALAVESANAYSHILGPGEQHTFIHYAEECHHDLSESASNRSLPIPASLPSPPQDWNAVAVPGPADSEPGSQSRDSSGLTSQARESTASDDLSGPSAPLLDVFDFEALQAQELKSIGSRHHSSGNCRPCVHEDRFVTGQKPYPCVNGASCEFCHQEHPNLKHEANRRRRMRKKVKLAMSRSEVPDETPS